RLQIRITPERAVPAPVRVIVEQHRVRRPGEVLEGADERWKRHRRRIHGCEERRTGRIGQLPASVFRNSFLHIERALTRYFVWRRDGVARRTKQEGVVHGAVTLRAAAAQRRRERLPFKTKPRATCRFVK